MQYTHSHTKKAPDRKRERPEAPRRLFRFVNNDGWGERRRGRGNKSSDCMREADSVPGIIPPLPLGQSPEIHRSNQAGNFLLISPRLIFALCQSRIIGDDCSFSISPLWRPIMRWCEESPRRVHGVRRSTYPPPGPAVYCLFSTFCSMPSQAPLPPAGLLGSPRTTGEGEGGMENVGEV